MEKESILVVDDDRDLANIIKVNLQRHGYDAEAVYDGNIACNIIKSSPPHLAILDYRLPGMNGLQIVRFISKIEVKMAIIMISSYGKELEAIKAYKEFKEGWFDFIFKPFEIQDLVDTVNSILQKMRKDLSEKNELYRLRRENINLREALKMIEGDDIETELNVKGFRWG